MLSDLSFRKDSTGTADSCKTSIMSPMCLLGQPPLSSETQWLRTREMLDGAIGRKLGSAVLHNFLKSEESIGKLSACSQKVSAQIAERFHLFSLAVIQKKTRSIPFTPSNSQQMLMPLDSSPATVPNIISFQRSGIWSSLNSTQQHSNRVKLFVCSAV